MHRALLLSEVVAAILQTEAAAPGFLHTCLFINRIFSLEATRMLWKGCGVRYNSATAGHISPDITHLANIVQTDHERAQFYADLIHILYFDEEGEYSDFLEEARWHKELSALQFPRLQEVGFYGSAAAMYMNTEDVLLHYAQPNVKEFALDQATFLSDSFLDSLSLRCPRLQTFTLGEIRNSSLSEDGIVRFVDNCTSLSCLNIRSGFLDTWTLKEFEALARHPKLELISIPNIADVWLDSLRHGDPSYPSFPKLKHFYTGISDQGVELLARYMPNLQTLSLTLQNVRPSYHLLASASNFKRITSLSIEFGQSSSITGADLVLLARSCSELKELNICEWEGSHPSGSGITDSIIDATAQHMKNISELILDFDRSDLLTWQSFLSIGRHCKNLLRLRLPCNFTWAEVTEAMDQMSKPEVISPKMWSLTLVLDTQIRGDMATDDVTIHAIATQLAAFAPKLSTFRLEGGNARDEVFAKTVDDICSPRYVPRLVGSTS